jgi:hypothetical protein
VFGLAVRMGVRFALMPLLERELAGMASAAAASMEGGDGAGDVGERPQRH